jgi:hypothetical protein
MDASFDAKKTATTIEGLAKRCIDDYSANKRTEAAADEQGIASALAAIWGDQEKIQAVGAELKKLVGKTLSADPNVDLTTDDKGNVTGVKFSPAFWDHGATANVEAKKNKVFVDVAATNGANDTGLKTTTFLTGGRFHRGPLDVRINDD